MPNLKKLNPKKLIIDYYDSLNHKIDIQNKIKIGMDSNIGLLEFDPGRDDQEA